MDGIIYVGVMAVVLIAFVLMIKKSNEDDNRESDLAE